jgi:antitoxin ParD1/3/4
MNSNTSISLGSYYEKFIEGRISAGRYKNASEMIRAALRLLEEEELKVKALKEAMQEGIASGFESGFDPEMYLQQMKTAKHG